MNANHDQQLSEAEAALRAGRAEIEAGNPRRAIEHLAKAERYTRGVRDAVRNQLAKKGGD